MQLHNNTISICSSCSSLILILLLYFKITDAFVVSVSIEEYFGDFPNQNIPVFRFQTQNKGNFRDKPYEIVNQKTIFCLKCPPPPISIMIAPLFLEQSTTIYFISTKNIII